MGRLTLKLIVKYFLIEKSYTLLFEYCNTLHLVQNILNFGSILPKEALEFYNAYKKSFL